MKILLPFLLVILFFIIIAIPTARSQAPEYVRGELLVRVADHKDPAQISREIAVLHNQLEFEFKEQVTKTMNIWLVGFDPDQVAEDFLKKVLLSHSDIHIVQRNHLGALRGIEPNDPFFDQQWQHRNTGLLNGIAGADIKSTKAWEITQGGLTPRGDTIVIAVIDNGFFQNHDDLKGNLWVNHKEIPGNGIDDDGNGYIDDYHGWNAGAQNGNVYSNGSHGLQVAGMIGATGNNEIGVAGLNWNIKIMQVRLGNVSESNVLRAYEYVLNHRRRYNASNGTEGAFVVATNSSWGIDRGRPEDAPLWCAFYDSLGMHGILSAAATANLNLNVDIIGDLPTGCKSDFLINVTSTNRNDERNTAGFGRNSIDLGSPGSGLVVLNRSNDVSTGGSGTSFATPLVAGAIGLMYAAPCNGFSENAIQDPATTALHIREFLLNGVDPISSLAGITKTGGRLNVYNGLINMLRACPDCPSPPRPELLLDELDALQLTWEEDTLNTYTSYQLLHRVAGETTWNTIDNAVSPYRLTGLVGCLDYEVALIGICGDETSMISISNTFRTDGCCEAPRDIDTIFVQPNAARIHWRPVLPADYYIVEYFNLSTGDIHSKLEFNSQTLLRGLMFCNEYSLRIASVCGQDTTAFSSPLRFGTKGCGACTETNYCLPGEGTTAPVFISRVSLVGIDNTSEASDSGFEDFRGNPAVLEIEETYPITIELDTINHGRVHIRVWIDYNHNGSFNPDGETALSIDNFDGNIINRNITIPRSARDGTTRMRVAAWDAELNDSLPEPCSPDGYFGEYEDYCVTIAMRICPVAEDLDTLSVGFTQAELGWTELDAGISYVHRFKRSDEEEYSTEETTGDNAYLLTGLEECTSYDFELLTVCDFDTSGYHKLTFITACPTNIEEINIEGVNVKVYPNPFRDMIHTRIVLDQTTSLSMRIVDISGRTHYYHDAGKLPSGEHSLIIDRLTNLPPGFYLLECMTDKGRIIAKLVKQ